MRRGRIVICFSSLLFSGRIRPWGVAGCHVAGRTSRPKAQKSLRETERERERIVGESESEKEERMERGRKREITHRENGGIIIMDSLCCKRRFCWTGRESREQPRGSSWDATNPELVPRLGRNGKTNSSFGRTKSLIFGR